MKLKFNACANLLTFGASDDWSDGAAKGVLRGPVGGGAAIEGIPG